jgi:hypothetical protein
MMAGKKSKVAATITPPRLSRAAADLWKCRLCGRSFANRNQSHFCSDVSIAWHFKNKPPKTRALFDLFVKEVKKHGPVKILPEKTRIAFQVRMSFAALMTRCGYLRGHMVLAERHDDPCFYKVETFSPRNHLHAFELRESSQLGAKQIGRFIGLAYAVGCQRHLQRRD